jgi:RNA 3'-terminal phosphate cyclase (ATP)
MAAPPPPVVTIDGSLHEGGGQIVRNAVALAAAARTPVTVTSIRAGRPKPGLRPQHAAGLRLVASLSDGGSLAGCEVGCTELTFVPGRLVAGPHAADAGTAGSTMLMAQAALPAALLAAAGGGEGGGNGSPSPSPLTTTLDLRGGTDAAMAPPADYAAHVLLPTLRRACGVRADLVIHRRGFFPRGGGRVELAVTALLPGQALPPVVLERGSGQTDDDPVASIAIHAVHAGRVKRAAVDAAVAGLVAAYTAATADSSAPRPAWPPPAVAALPPSAAPGDGGSVTAVATTRSGLLFGASAPLAPKDDFTAVGARLGRELAEDVGRAGASAAASVDRWLADQLVVFGALASGTSRWTTAGPPTPHARAAMAVATALTGARFTVREAGGGGWTVECEGAGVAAGL